MFAHYNCSTKSGQLPRGPQVHCVAISFIHIYLLCNTVCINTFIISVDIMFTEQAAM